MAVDAQVPYLVIVAVFGLLIGSFLNVCIYRIPRNVSVIAPRSFCPQCEAHIAWYDNVPLMSYAMLRGKCRKCKGTIGIRYLIVEFATAIAFVVVGIEYCWSLAAVKWGVFEAILMVLFWSDLEVRILPDELTLGGTAAGLVFAALVPVSGVFADLFLSGATLVWRSYLNAALGAALLAGPIWLLAMVYARVRKREGLGLGDVKLLVMFGVFLGLEKGVLAVLIGSVGGSIVSLLYIWLARKKASTYELPFGSFLCASAALVPLLSK